MENIPERKLKVLLLYRTFGPSVNLCGYIQLKWLADHGRVEFRDKRIMDVKKRDLEWCEIAVFVRGDALLDEWMAKVCHKAGKTVVYILDDDLLNVPITIFETDVFDVANSSEHNPCYLCARMRRGYLYSKAKELGCNKIALGHHFNDVIETTVMAMFYGAQLQAMLPKLHSSNFEGMELIRPMYCIHEDDIIRWKNAHELEFIQCACRFTENCTMCDNGGGGSKRQEVKQLLKRLKKDNPDIEKSIFNSIHSVCLDTMPGWKTKGEEHSFLENYDKK